MGLFDVFSKNKFGQEQLDKRVNQLSDFLGQKNIRWDSIQLINTTSDWSVHIHYAGLEISFVLDLGRYTSTYTGGNELEVNQFVSNWRSEMESYISSSTSCHDFMILKKEERDTRLYAFMDDHFESNTILGYNRKTLALSNYPSYQNKAIPWLYETVGLWEDINAFTTLMEGIMESLGTFFGGYYEVKVDQEDFLISIRGSISDEMTIRLNLGKGASLKTSDDQFHLLDFNVFKKMCHFFYRVLDGLNLDIEDFGPKFKMVYDGVGRQSFEFTFVNLFGLTDLIVYGETSH